MSTFTGGCLVFSKGTLSHCKEYKLAPDGAYAYKEAAPGTDRGTTACKSMNSTDRAGSSILAADVFQPQGARRNLEHGI